MITFDPSIMAREAFRGVQYIGSSVCKSIYNDTQVESEVLSNVSNYV